MSIAACFEAQGVCEKEVIVFNNTVFDKPTCDYNAGFVDPSMHSHTFYFF